MSTLFHVWHSIQNSLFPWLEETLDPLTEKEQQFIQVVSLMDLEGHMTQYRWHGKGTCPIYRVNAMSERKRTARGIKKAGLVINCMWTASTEIFPSVPF